MKKVTELAVDLESLPKWLTPAQAAKVIGRGRSWVDKAIRDGRMKAESFIRGNKQETFRIRRTDALAIRKRLEAGLPA